ncbi:MAG: hypothetical protein BWY75_02082 [bacterium ADurb.Bin425]|nr:MAG: hypothetical protein BWY75_02082 [bacterium ADurb.Bin425]
MLVDQLGKHRTKHGGSVGIVQLHGTAAQHIFYDDLTLDTTDEGNGDSHEGQSKQSRNAPPVHSEGHYKKHCQAKQSS